MSKTETSQSNLSPNTFKGALPFSRVVQDFFQRRQCTLDRFPFRVNVVAGCSVVVFTVEAGLNMVLEGGKKFCSMVGNLIVDRDEDGARQSSSTDDSD